MGLIRLGCLRRDREDDMALPSSRGAAEETPMGRLTREWQQQQQQQPAAAAAAAGAGSPWQRAAGGRG